MKFKKLLTGFSILCMAATLFLPLSVSASESGTTSLTTTVPDTHNVAVSYTHLLAIDILTFLTGISSRDGEKFPVLRKAVRAVTQSETKGLLYVIGELRKRCV